MTSSKQPEGRDSGSGAEQVCTGSVGATSHAPRFHDPLPWPKQAEAGSELSRELAPTLLQGSSTPQRRVSAAPMSAISTPPAAHRQQKRQLPRLTNVGAEAFQKRKPRLARTPNRPAQAPVECSAAATDAVAGVHPTNATPSAGWTQPASGRVAADIG